jgi:hypothetical protein
MEVKDNPTRRETKYRIVQGGSDPAMTILVKQALMKGAGERRSKHVWNERLGIMFASPE